MLVLTIRKEQDREHPFEESLIGKVVLEMKIPTLVYPNIMKTESSNEDKTASAGAV